MITKLLIFFDVARPDAPTGARADTHLRARAERSLPPAANIRCVPRLQAPLECKWQINPLTGALVAIWFDPSANTGTKPIAELEIIGPRRCLNQSRQAARGRAVRCHVAARRAA
jgi:hypothetical protein